MKLKFRCGALLSRRRLPIVLAAVSALYCGLASAAVETSTFAVNQNVTLSGFTNSGPHTFFTIPTVFDQFDTSLGTLNSATLSWGITGHIVASGNLEVQATLSYNNKSVSKNADTDGSPPNDVDFSFTDFVVLLPGLVEGLGTFSGGNFVGTVANVGGLFPWGATLSAVGNLTVTYDYIPVTAPPPDSTIPEPTTLALLGLGLAGIAASRRRRS